MECKTVFLYHGKAKLAGASHGPNVPIGRQTYILHHPSLSQTSEECTHYTTNEAGQPEAINPVGRNHLSVLRSLVNFDKESQMNLQKTG